MKKIHYWGEMFEDVIELKGCLRYSLLVIFFGIIWLIILANL